MTTLLRQHSESITHKYLSRLPPAPPHLWRHLVRSLEPLLGALYTTPMRKQVHGRPLNLRANSAVFTSAISPLPLLKKPKSTSYTHCLQAQFSPGSSRHITRSSNSPRHRFSPLIGSIWTLLYASATSGTSGGREAQVRESRRSVEHYISGVL